MLRVRGLEVAGFVEYIVGGQQHLALLEENLATADEGRGVGYGLPGIVLRFADEADDGWEGRWILASFKSSVRLRSMKEGRSTRSCGG